MKHIKTVAIADDHLSFRQGMTNLLNEFKEIRVLFDAANGVELLEKMSPKQPDVVFIDLEMPVMDGIEATVKVRERFPAVKIIILTMHHEEELINFMIAKGAHGFLSKNTDIKIIIEAIKMVVNRGFYFDFDLSKAMARNIILNNNENQRFMVSSLTSREKEILRLICQELTNHEIADKLCLSHRTIEAHRERILQKTGAKNSVGAALYAVRYNIIQSVKAANNQI